MASGNKIRVVLDSFYQEKIRFESGLELFQDVYLNHEQKTTLWGTVVHVPYRKAVCDCSQCQQGIYCNYSEMGVQEDVQIGDKVCFRYDVVADGDINPDGTGRVHTNLIHIDGKPQWMVNYRQLFMIERDGVRTMAGGNILCDEVHEPQLQSSFLILNEDAAGNKQSAKVIPHQLKVVAVGANKKGIAEGDMVIVEPAIIQHYNISGVFGKDNAIINQRHVKAKIA